MRLKKSSFILLFVFFLSSVLILFPLLKPGFFVSDDGEWMIIRLSAFYQSLREGQIPVRFLGRLNHSYGYPVATFLYPGFLYAGSVIHLLGFSFADSIKILLAGSVFASVCFTFLWLRKRFGERASLFGALALLFSPYVIFDLYRRGSVGEIFSLPWMSLSLYGIAAGKPRVFAVAVGLLLISHNTLALLFLAVLVGYLFVTKTFRSFLPWLLLGFGMSAFFWVPALMERKYVIFDQVKVSNPNDYFLQIQNWGLLGLANMFVLILTILPIKRSKYFSFFLALTAGSFFMVLPVSALLWGIPSLVQLVQFPYRFLAVALFSVPWLIGDTIENLNGAKRNVIIAVIVLLWFIQIFTGLAKVDPVIRTEGFYETNEATTTVSDEYMPRWVIEKPLYRASSRIEIYSGKASIDIKRATTQLIVATVTAQEDSVVQLNTIYYPGWGILLDGKSVVPDFQNPQGVMQVRVKAGTHRLVANFRETVPRFLCDIVSIVSVLLLGISLFVKPLRHNAQKSTVRKKSA